MRIPLQEGEQHKLPRMPPNLEPPVDQHEFLDWVFDCAIELVEDGREAAIDELAALRPSLHEQVRQLTDLARKVAFGPKPNRPVIPGYSLLDELGEGGMGTVWLARQKNLGGRMVAVKVLSRSLGISPRSRSRFRTEANAIGRLRHPHIVDVYDVIEGEGLQAYAMEWVEGSTLARIIERVKGIDVSRRGNESSMKSVREALGVPLEAVGSPGGPPDRNYVLFICRVGVAISRALTEVHRAGLVHRDVKPSNILIRRDGTPLLSDFGLVRDPESTIATQAGDSSGQFAGTAAFAAPEQLRADGAQVDGRADVYSLGATMYSALVLRLPFEGHNHLEVLRRIQLGLATPLRKLNPRIPRDLQTIVAKAMDPDMARRYQTADEFGDDLDRLLNLQPIKARPAGLPTRAVKLARRNRATLVSATLGGVLAIGAIAVALTYFIGFPIWSKSHLDEARLVLLDPEQSDALFSSLYFHLERAGGLPIAAAAADRALSHYDAAVRFAPFDANLSQEREWVRMARQITGRAEAAPVTMADAARFPLTAEFAGHVHSGWKDFNVVRDYAHLDAVRFQSATSDDLRALGLLAMLCGDPQITMDAWTVLDLKGNPGPMVEASFGIVYLVTKQYGRAYPRLRNAVEAFPNVGFLTVHLAEAATRCGDFDKAQLWLDQAANMPRLDRFNGLKRVQAGLYAASGRDADARRVYEELLAEKLNIVAFDEYARFLETQGDLERAMIVYLHTIGHGSVREDLFRRFIEAAGHWWAGLDDADRRQLIQANEPWKEFRHDRIGILPTYAKCIRDLGGEPPPGGTPATPSRTE